MRPSRPATRWPIGCARRLAHALYTATAHAPENTDRVLTYLIDGPRPRL